MFFYFIHTKKFYNKYGDKKNAESIILCVEFYCWLYKFICKISKGSAILGEKNNYKTDKNG